MLRDYGRKRQQQARGTSGHPRKHEWTQSSAIAPDSRLPPRAYTRPVSSANTEVLDSHTRSSIEPTGSSGGGVDANAVARAVAEVLQGAKFEADGRQFGRLVVQSSAARSGRAGQVAANKGEGMIRKNDRRIAYWMFKLGLFRTRLADGACKATSSPGCQQVAVELDVAASGE